MEPYMINIKVMVTQADIDAGYKNNCYRCPVALAAARALAASGITTTDLTVGATAASFIVRKDKRYIGYRAALTDQAQRWINNFDECGAEYSRPLDTWLTFFETSTRELV
jgi:hypothetical protein